ncbi:hypothetical protein BKA58DRAFT_242644 [Alternaria rosae]|uniref:uncharacterized protein n=1 Tax=Alternaria rosae TaxID=1187941 RepID=UPI001E8DF237|nr:uncharacterized protein BKA58DRAFT_242644 [Alternaria rosae]KAH6865309.1 hypothetical protein BKA58DRAFT_242644 [Alternaria rosae]
MPKCIHYEVEEAVSSEYMLLIAKATDIDVCVDQSDDHSLLEGIADLIEYETGSMSHTTADDELDDSLTQAVESSNFSVLPLYEDFTTAFHDLSSAGFWCLRYEPFLRRASADREFAKIAKASIRYLKDNHECSFEPFVPYYQQYMPDALELVYGHMGYSSLSDAVFIHMATWYDPFYSPWCCIHLWQHCRCELLRDDQRSFEILFSRDVPTALSYMHQNTDGLVPIDRLAFQDLVDMTQEYLAFTYDYDIWPDEKVAAFREFSGPVIDWLYYENGIEPIECAAFNDMAAAVTGYIPYEPPHYFPRFLQLPAELRKIFYHHYLLANGPTLLCRHDRRPHGWDDWHDYQACCRWDYPSSLTLCNKSKRTLFLPYMQRSSYLLSSLPALAFICGQLKGEVVVYMLQCTQRIVLNLEKGERNYDGGAWFYDALTAIPHGDGLRAVKNLVFRIENVSQSSSVPRSPMVELAVACTSLREIQLIVSIQELLSINCQTGVPTLRSVDELLDRLAVRPLLNCELLCQICISMAHQSFGLEPGSNDWDVLDGVGKWLIKGFLVQQERRVQVTVCDRNISWCTPGEVVTLDEADEKEVDEWLRVKKVKSLLEQAEGR